MSGQVCPVCGGRQRPMMVMCDRCWRKVPKPLQVAVYRAWDARKAGRDGALDAHEAAKAAAIKRAMAA